MKTRLETVPFHIDAEAIALGMLDMFTDEEKTVLRFGMLPATKMEITKKVLRDKFTGDCTAVKDDMYTAICNTGERCRDFKMETLVNEAMHLICLELYKHGNLVV